VAYEKRPVDAIRAIRKRLENPYAYSEDLEEHARSALYRSENPYATLAGWDGVEAGIPSEAIVARQANSPPPTTRLTKAQLSKVDFRSECQRIFLPYVPPHLPRRIPQHQRDFIARNERRAPGVRFRLAESLKRYDLSSTPGISPQFNRELHVEISEIKLRRLETEIPDDD
jgi:hypothetical protein